MRTALAWFGAILLLTGCSSGDTLSLTFDGERCTYEGPTEMVAGSVDLVFVNESDGTATVELAELLKDKTAADLIERIQPEPSTKHAPWWTRSLGTWHAVDPGESHLWEGDLEAGDYSMVCVRIEPLGVWFGTGLSVEG